MALKALLNKAAHAALPKEIQEQYVQQGEDYVLDVEEKDYKTRLSEFRENNKALSKEKEQLVAAAERFKGVDPDKYKQAMDALEKIESMEDKELLKSGNLDAIIGKRTAQMQRDFETQLSGFKKTNEELTANYAKTRTSLHQMMINDSVAKALAKVGVVRKGAYDDVIARAHRHWSVDEASGELKAKDLYDSKAQPITSMEGFAKQLLEQAPFLFEDSKGGGAQGGDRGQGGNGTKQIAWNDPVAIGKNLSGIMKGETVVNIPVPAINNQGG